MPDQEMKSRRVSGEDLHLAPGQELFLQLAEERVRLRCAYLGRRGREYLIVDPPLVPDFKARFAPGTKVTARLLSGGTAYGFVSSILHQTLRPSPLVFLDYPYTVEVVSLRSSERVETFVPAALAVDRGTAHGVITDLSSGGCHFAADLEANPGPLESLAAGAAVLISFATSTAERISDLPAQVHSARRDLGAIHLGLSFAGLPPEMEGRIAALVADIARFAGR